jgi:hypothetical protein
LLSNEIHEQDGYMYTFFACVYAEFKFLQLGYFIDGASYILGYMYIHVILVCNHFRNISLVSNISDH